MSTHAYSESQLVEQPAIGLFAALGWQTVSARGEMPKATFLAFTGTPLIAGEERTREVFGDYVSIYDFQQSVEDGATVPLFYENRTPELELVNPDLNDDIVRLIEDAGLDDERGRGATQFVSSAPRRAARWRSIEPRRRDWNGSRASCRALPRAPPC